MTPSLRAVLIVALALVAAFMDFAWDNPWLMAGLT
jgi:hypothetical protein